MSALTSAPEASACASVWRSKARPMPEDCHCGLTKSSARNHNPVHHPAEAESDDLAFLFPNPEACRIVIQGKGRESRTQRRKKILGAMSSIHVVERLGHDRHGGFEIIGAGWSAEWAHGGVTLMEPVEPSSRRYRQPMEIGEIRFPFSRGALEGRPRPPWRNW
jgi:hypothetical protein